MSNQNKLVFDIETAGNEFESLDEISQKYLLRYAENEESQQEAKDGLSFYPLTGEVVVIGMLNPETGKGISLVRNDKKSDLPKELEGILEIRQGTEKEMLEQFWEIVKSYNCFISFYGRGFDVPFLMIRSAILGVKPTKNLLSNRYLFSQMQNAKHIDLADQLTFYGASTKKFNLHMWTKAFGIKSPKEDGVTGDNVTALYKEGKIRDIIEYNLRDLKSTSELYKKWDEYLNI